MSWSFWVLAWFATAVLAVIQFCDPQGQPLNQPLKSIVEWVYPSRLWIAIAMISLQAVCGLGVWFVHIMRPIDTAKAKLLLENAVSHHFSKMDAAKHVYRATLFKIRGWESWPGQWLGIVSRSGETYNRSNTVFLIDRAKAENCTGLAGLCFRAQGQTIIQVVEAAEGEKEKYITLGNLADEEYSDINCRSVVFFATGVKRQNGKLWGVLVLDSNDPSQAPKIRGKDQLTADMEIWAVSIGMLIN